jgi:hypothetical protein
MHVGSQGAEAELALAPQGSQEAVQKLSWRWLPRAARELCRKLSWRWHLVILVVQGKALCGAAGQVARPAQASHDVVARAFVL